MNRYFQIFLTTGALMFIVGASVHAQNFANAPSGEQSNAVYGNPYGQQTYQSNNYPSQYAYPNQMNNTRGQPGQQIMMQPVMIQQMPMQQQDLIDPNTSSYTLGPGDILEILVSRHPEVSGTYVINQEGKIQYEFVGDLEIKELNKSQLKELLIQKLSEYIITPDVTVKISGYNSKVVFVIGEVGIQGKLIMKGDTITVHEAVMQAGLLLPSAKAGKAVLITPSEKGKPIKKRINLRKLLYHGDMRENLVMKPGDTLYVPPTFLTKTMRAMSPVAAPISTATGTTRNVQGF